MSRWFLICILAYSAGLSAAPTQLEWTKADRNSKNWNLSLGYQARANMAEATSAKTYEHTVLLDYSYFYQSFIIFVGGGFGYYSVGSDIPQEEGNPWLEDLSLGVEKSSKLTDRQRLTSAVLLSLPTGSEAAYEQYVGIFRARSALSSRLASRFVMTNQVQIGYVANTYYYSPTRLEANPEWVGDYALGGVIEVSQIFFVRLLASMRYERSVDASQSVGSRQVATLGFKDLSWNGSISFINGSYFDEGPARYWAFDQFRQMVLVGAGYEF